MPISETVKKTMKPSHDTTLLLEFNLFACFVSHDVHVTCIITQKLESRRKVVLVKGSRTCLRICVQNNARTIMASVI